MTVVVSVQAVGEMTRLRRYEAGNRRPRRCTHEGFYDPVTVSPPGVVAYMDHGPAQDRTFIPGFKAAGRRPA